MPDQATADAMELVDARTKAISEYQGCGRGADFVEIQALRAEKDVLVKQLARAQSAKAETPDERAQREEVDDDVSSAISSLHDRIDELETDNEILRAGAPTNEAAAIIHEADAKIVDFAKRLALRDEVLDFALVMEEKFRKHDDDGWFMDGGDLEFFLRRLAEEIREMFDAMVAGKPEEEVRRECADVANFALLIAYNYEPITTDAMELASRKLSDLMAKLFSPSGEPAAS